MDIPTDIEKKNPAIANSYIGGKGYRVESSEEDEYEYNERSEDEDSDGVVIIRKKKK